MSFRIKRPGWPARVCSTPQSAQEVGLLGGARLGSVSVTSDELRAMFRLYEYADEQHESVEQRIFSTAGDTLHCLRHAEADGLRMIALIARFIEPGHDPVCAVARLLQHAGYDLTTGWEQDDG